MRFARAISYLFHPLLMPTVVLVILFQTDTYLKFSTTPYLRGMICSLVFFSTFLMPLLISLLLYKNRQIKSLEMETVDERTLPLLMTLIFYIATFFLLKKASLSYLVYSSFMAATLTVFAVFLVHVLLKWKISAHMAGIGGVIGAFVAFSIKLSVNMALVIMLSIVIAGLLGYARLYLKSHTPAQVYTGFVTGFMAQLFLML